MSNTENSQGKSREHPSPKIDTILSAETPEPSLDSIHQLLFELDIWAEDMRRQGDAEAEAVDKIFYSALPVALFHATTREKADKIAREGLLPSRLKFDDEAVVSLSDTIGYAKFCASTTQGVDPADLVVLEVTSRGLKRDLTKSYLKLDNPLQTGEALHEVHYAEPISPDWIHELSAQEVEEIEQQEARI